MEPVQIMPPTWSDERMHVLDASCWCHPLLDVGDNTLKHRGVSRQ